MYFPAVRPGRVRCRGHSLGIRRRFDRFYGFQCLISADIAIVCALRGSQRSDWTEVPAEAGLPALPEYGVFQYVRNNVNNAPIQELATMVRTAYSQPALPGGKGPAEWWGTG